MITGLESIVGAIEFEEDKDRDRYIGMSGSDRVSHVTADRHIDEVTLTISCEMAKLGGEVSIIVPADELLAAAARALAAAD